MVFWETLGPDIDKGLYVAQELFYTQSYFTRSLESCIKISIYSFSWKKKKENT